MHLAGVNVTWWVYAYLWAIVAIVFVDHIRLELYLCDYKKDPRVIYWCVIGAILSVQLGAINILAAIFNF
jgi:hypothetical protein